MVGETIVIPDTVNEPESPCQLPVTAKQNNTKCEPTKCGPTKMVSLRVLSKQIFDYFVSNVNYF